MLLRCCHNILMMMMIYARWTVQVSLPAKTSSTHEVRLSADERRIYDRLYRESRWVIYAVNDISMIDSYTVEERFADGTFKSSPLPYSSVLFQSEFLTQNWAKSRLESKWSGNTTLQYKEASPSLVWLCGTLCRRPCMNHHWHWLSSVHS